METSMAPKYVQPFITEAINQAHTEIEEEQFRALVEVEKEKIRQRNRSRRWWHAFVPFTITIKRRVL